MVGNVTKWGHVFDDPEQKLDDQSTQYGKTRVRRNESNLNDLDPDMDPSRLWKDSDSELAKFSESSTSGQSDCSRTCDENYLNDEKLCAVVRIKKYLAELSGVQNKWPRGEQLTLTRKGRRTRACM